MSIPLLILIDVNPDGLSRFESAGFVLCLATTPNDRANAIGTYGTEIRAVLTNGSTGFTADEIAMFPALEIICALGAGYEKIDLPAALSRNIVVTNGAGTNDASVADHAMALLMSIARGIPQADAAVRRGEWAQSRQPRPMVSGKKLGILGLGNIGRQIAQRAANGFNMQISYHNRTPLADSPYTYCATPEALATWADFMVVATPGGAATRHLVNAPVLAALGPSGFLINICRGSVVDTAALIAALQQNQIAGAALDVLDGEPHVPSEFSTLTNIIFTPHIAGRSPEAVAATAQLALQNLTAHFAGEPVLTPVPMSPPS
ncbi:2-hydroxyacid dehydrogenase [Pseudomonas sp. CCI3.2]|uniref:2-hydroxyacid dehydrogenase n=1 Tax=unclassified Pseudomonas TaxID=196821 RepID=UPI002AC9130D|nr:MULTISPECIES: 2-hydroxyacid dehydrogenase [unclassified Pseudomonas]MEB0076385.1 2-hydroxyacid dehydrogenase [Pseudomonas sp. MH10out]MEB0092722.1 2-hydroxyacid dehydrogenase [Pseudomonas sp. CCI4.2]MEB0100780.1 2-hydroxyacid dehydrogenase [Pseudomonas sp. CCI3.2]MEB0128835.1 2-hydroxyacid dehydrogenase [Pseudomonas sp. CCI2.4]MEB0160704.1 2-hydroxyacid dehydrogenase [Pseudomonas sp. AH2 (2023)]